MIIEIAQNLYTEKYRQEMSWEEFCTVLSEGLEITRSNKIRSLTNLPKLKAAIIAHEYNIELLVHHLQDND